MKNNDLYELYIRSAKEGERYSEGSVVELNNCHLLIAYQEFLGGCSDFSPGRIAGMLSKDKGISWEDYSTIQENVADTNVMCPTLLRLQSDVLAHFYLHKNSVSDCQAYMTQSSDEGKSWGNSVRITAEQGYHVVNNDRVIQLKSGRLLVPVAHTPHCWCEQPWKSFCYFSDDNGSTWVVSDNKISLPKGYGTPTRDKIFGALEPGVVELIDGRILMVIRTQLGHIYKSYSTDGGSTWTEALPMSLVSPGAPSSIKRIPDTGDLLIIWNNNFDPEEFMCGRRCPLTAAISRDDGETWENIRNIETDESKDYAYTSITFLKEKVLLTYFTIPGAHAFTGGLSLKLKIIPVGWFY